MARAIRKLELFAPTEIARLVRRYQQQHDVRAADVLVRAHLRLVSSIARQFRWSRQDMSELVQVGIVGLLRAIAKFDPERGVLLSTYAVLWIRALMLRFVLENWRLVRVGTTSRQWQSFFRARQMGDEASTADRSLARHIALPELSLDARLGDGEHASGASLVSFLRASDAARPDVCLERAEARARFRAAVAEFAAGLEGRERRLFEGRWLEDEPRTLTSMGDELGVSRERTGQIERRILGRLGAFLSERLGDLHVLAPALAAA
jgi:RNA polymerase sigma-32 factor